MRSHNPNTSIDDNTEYINVSIENANGEYKNVITHREVQYFLTRLLVEERAIDAQVARALRDFVIDKMLLGKKEIYEDWLKTVEKSRSREENPPETWKFIVEKYYSEYLGTILEIATEVEPVVVEGSSDYTYCFVYKNKLIRAADLRLLETSYRLLLRTVKQGSIPRARWTIAQHATRTISYGDLNPVGYFLTRNNLVLNPVELKVYENFVGVFSNTLGAEIEEKDLETIKSIVVSYSWLEAERLIRETYCPLFSKVFENVFPTEKEKMQALEAFGAIFYPGPVRKAFVVVGEPGIGKSVLADAIKYTLGDYAASLSFARLFGRDGSKVTGELAGKYANIVSETPRMLLTHADLFNELTGDDVKQVEVKFKRPFLAYNTCKHYIFCNTIPLFANVDEAVLDRLYVIECTGTRPPNEDPTLRQKLRKETKGILMWLLTNFHYLNKSGFVFKHAPTPEEVEQMVSRAASPVLEFIEMYCETGPHYRETGEDLYTAYLQYAKLKGDLRPLGRNRFYDALRAAGYPSYKPAGATYFKGLRLLKTEDTRSHLTDY